MSGRDLNTIELLKLNFFLLFGGNNLFKLLVTLDKSLFSGNSFFRIISNVITFPNIQIFFLPFNPQTVSKILSVKYLIWDALLRAL